MVAVANPLGEENLDPEAAPEEPKQARDGEGGRPKTMSVKQRAIHEFLARFSMDDATNDLLRVAEKEGVPIARHHIEQVKKDVMMGMREWPEPLGLSPATTLKATEIVRRWPADADPNIVVRELAKQGIAITRDFVVNIRTQDRAIDRLIGDEPIVQIVPPEPPSEPLTVSEAILREDAAKFDMPPAPSIAESVARMVPGPAPATEGEASRTVSVELAIMACVLEVGLPAVKQIVYEMEERMKLVLNVK